MSPEELASKELAAWRKRENRHVSLLITFTKSNVVMCALVFGMENSEAKMHTFLISQTIEMIEKEQREAERRPITKITHKGEIEIESQEPMKAHELPEVRGTTHLVVFSSKRVLLFLFFVFLDSLSLLPLRQKSQ